MFIRKVEYLDPLSKIGTKRFKINQKSLLLDLTLNQLHLNYITLQYTE